MFTFGAGTPPSNWKSLGIVKLVLLSAVGGLIKSPLKVICEVPALRSRSLVVEIPLTVTEVELRNSTEAG